MAATAREIVGNIVLSGAQDVTRRLDAISASPPRARFRLWVSALQDHQHAQDRTARLLREKLAANARERSGALARRIG